VPLGEALIDETAFLFVLGGIWVASRKRARERALSLIRSTEIEIDDEKISWRSKFTSPFIRRKLWPPTFQRGESGCTVNRGGVDYTFHRKSRTWFMGRARAWSFCCLRRLEVTPPRRPYLRASSRQLESPGTSPGPERDPRNESGKCYYPHGATLPQQPYCFGPGLYLLASPVTHGMGSRQVVAVQK
jgi:hypothetical protein